MITLADHPDPVETLRKVVFQGMQSGKKMIDLWIEKVQDMSTHDKGNLFEELCKLVLLETYPEVWRLAEVPDHVRAELALRKGDFGIDLIARDHRGFYAVQAKFRKTRLSWRELSTFDALCTRTGPYVKHIVMTTAPSVRRIGRKTSKDSSFCIGSWRSLAQDFWIKAAHLSGQPLGLGSDLGKPDLDHDLGKSDHDLDFGKSDHDLGKPDLDLDLGKRDQDLDLGKSDHDLNNGEHDLEKPPRELTEREKVAALRIAYFSKLDTFNLT